MRKMGTVVALAALLSSGCYESTQGDEGDAGASSSGGGLTDPEAFCTERSSWVCTRDEFAGRISAGELSACLAAIPSRCAGAVWPAGCAPTDEQTQACIILLRRADLLELPAEELLTYPDCTFCR